MSAVSIPSSSDFVESGPVLVPEACAVRAELVVGAELGIGSEPGAGSDDVADLFASVAWRVLAGWVVGCIALFALVLVSGAIGNEHVFAADQLVWVSLASGLITLASLVPGSLIGRGVSADKVVRAGVAIVATSSAMGIRFAGTVALFVACRYYFGRESLQVVFLVVGWYVYLTSIEVFQLACGVASLDRRLTN